MLVIEFQLFVYALNLGCPYGSDYETLGVDEIGQMTSLEYQLGEFGGIRWNFGGIYKSVSRNHFLVITKKSLCNEINKLVVNFEV